MCRPCYSAVTRALCAGGWFAFGPPQAVLATHAPGQVAPLLREVERVVWRRGMWAAGFLAYEAAPAFDDALRVHAPRPGLPLAWFGLYHRPIREFKNSEWLSPAAEEAVVARLRWERDVSREAYLRVMDAIKREIARGATYQVNYTMRLRAAVDFDPWSLFAVLASRQNTPYCAWLDTGRFAVCSASPELFLSIDGERIVSRPMKGTAPRGRFPAEDRERASRLRASVKDRAENVMIVDMVRNDLGRIARIGSVRVEGLCELERYPTVWQLTSTVAGRTAAGLEAVMAAMFPCASVTGAPKVSAMRIIEGLESGPRGVYTGVVGLVAPGRRALFNVAIRTALVDREQQLAEYGAGGGVVWDSRPDAEYRECLDKTSVLCRPRPRFRLLESLRWEPGGGYWLQQRHLARLAASARYFGFVCDPEAVAAVLRQAAARLPPRAHKVRLLLERGGGVEIEAQPLSGQRQEPVRLGLAAVPVDAEDVFLFHKTTRRSVYEQARTGCARGDDVLLYNRAGEVTETTIANLVVELDERRCTPPVASGLLAGVLRAEMLEEGALGERVITLEDLARARRLWVINSVRGMREARLLASPGEIVERARELRAGGAPADAEPRSEARVGATGACTSR